MSLTNFSEIVHVFSNPLAVASKAVMIFFLFGVVFHSKPHSLYSRT